MHVACFQIGHRKSQQHGVDKLGYSNRQTPPVDEPYLEVGGSRPQTTFRQAGI